MNFMKNNLAHTHTNEDNTINKDGYQILDFKLMPCSVYVFFCVIPRRLNFICRHFRKLYLFHLPFIIYLLAYEDGTDRVFRNVDKIQTPGNYPEENIQRLTDL
jgi:hypothetical protein